MARFAFACALILLGSICDAASLTGLGSGPTQGTLATGVSADGSTVIGVYRLDHDNAFRWTPSTGLQLLGYLPGDLHSSPMAVSANGLAIAGLSNHITYDPQNGDSIDNYRGFHWTPSSGMVDLGLLPGSLQTVVTAMSADGSAVFGQSIYERTYHPFRWTAATGIVPIGDHASGVSSEVTAVSADGSVATGSQAGVAFRWTAANGMKPLGGLEPGFYFPRAMTPDGLIITGSRADGTSSEAFRWNSATGEARYISSEISAEPYLISTDGSVIAGYLRTQTMIQAFRWTEGTGLVPLGFLPDGSPAQSELAAMSADGSILVGRSTSSYDNAFYWDQEHGMQFLKDVLVAQGVPSAAGWKLGDIAGISAEGTVIVGHGFNFAANGNTEGWVAVIPEPASFAATAIIFPIFFRRRR